MNEYLSHLQQKYPFLRSYSQSQLYDLSSVIQSESALEAGERCIPRPLATLCPYDFQGLDNSIDSFMSAYFNWRWFQRDSTNFRLVTVEFGGQNRALSYGPPRVKPRDLAALASDYHDDLFNCVFNWRWFTRGQEKYRVITLETIPNVSGLSFPIVNTIHPRHLIGLPDDKQDWDELHFYWRWFRRNDDNFRVLTLE